jgi:peroxiredoxin
LDVRCQKRTETKSWILPIPATYVIDCDGIVALAFVDVNYRNRLEPTEILAALHALAKEAATT